MKFFLICFFFFLPHDPFLIGSARHSMSSPQKKSTSRKQREAPALGRRLPRGRGGIPCEQRTWWGARGKAACPAQSPSLRLYTLSQARGERPRTRVSEAEAETSGRGFEKRHPPPPRSPGRQQGAGGGGGWGGEALDVVLVQRSDAASPRSSEREQGQENAAQAPAGHRVTGRSGVQASDVSWEEARPAELGAGNRARVRRDLDGAMTEDQKGARSWLPMPTRTEEDAPHPRVIGQNRHPWDSGAIRWEAAERERRSTSFLRLTEGSLFVQLGWSPILIHSCSSIFSVLKDNVLKT